MKTAICFSGELRSIDKTYSLMKEKLMNRFSNYDIFYHTWSDDPDLSKIHYLEKDDHTKNISIENRITLPERPIYDKNRRTEVFVQGLLRQLYCLKTCNSLKTQYEKENNFVYDVVVRIRPDLLLVNNTCLEKSAESWDMKNYVYTTDHDDYHGYNDRFYFSNSENMDFLSNRLDLLDMYMDLGGVYHYETFFKFCIHYKELQIARSNMEFVLLRTDGKMSSSLLVS
jgi:hypothetical protein